MERTRDFIDVPELFGAGWQATKAVQTERGEWCMSVRLGPYGLVETFYAGSSATALLSAGNHAAAVNGMLARKRPSSVAPVAVRS